VNRTALTSQAPPRGSRSTARPSRSVTARTGWNGSSHESAVTVTPATGRPRSRSTTGRSPPPPSAVGSTSGTSTSGSPSRRSTPAAPPPTATSALADREKASVAARGRQPSGSWVASPSSST
jgi:hypothetical protein